MTPEIDISFHYPPELMSLLIDTIPRLFRSKRDVLTFFRGAGVAARVVQDLEATVSQARDTINKYEIVRNVLTRLNEGQEALLRQRREVLKRVVDFEDFSTCWPDDQLKAKGLVAEIRRLVNVKDSFTRINEEFREERQRRRAEAEERAEALRKREQEFEAIKGELFALFGAADPWKRGKALEGILNRLFGVSGVLLKEAFTLRGREGEGVVEQIDGVIELDGNVYLVEAKWWNQALGPGEVAQHQVRVFNRGQARGIMIAYPGYTDAAVASCRDSLAHAVFVLCELEEIVRILDQRLDLPAVLKRKVTAAIVEKVPLAKVTDLAELPRRT